VRYVNLYAFTAKNSENGGQRAYLIYEGLKYRYTEFNKFKGDI
jgi:hypothetical protein